MEALATEEGLASLNTLRAGTDKLLWSPALSYYAQVSPTLTSLRLSSAGRISRRAPGCMQVVVGGLWGA